MSATEVLQKQSSVLISQKVDWLECIPCCEVINEYDVYETDDNFNDQKNLIGQVVEQEGNALCLYCCKMMREYNTEFKVQGASIASSNRPYKIPMNFCACIDFCKPTLSIAKGREKIGQVDWPCWCMLYPTRGCLSCMEFDVRDQGGNLIYTIEGKCLQLGFLCWQFGCIDGCSRREYRILDATKSEVGKIVNIYNGILNEVCTRADRYGIHFPTGSTVDQKIVLIKTAVFLDYLQYWA